MRIEYADLVVERFEGTHLYLLKRGSVGWEEVCCDLPEWVAVRFFDEAVHKGARLRKLRELAEEFNTVFGGLE